MSEARSAVTKLALSILAATGISATPVMAEKGGTELESVYAAAFTPAE